MVDVKPDDHGRGYWRHGPRDPRDRRGRDMAELHLHYWHTRARAPRCAEHHPLFARGRELISETRYRDTPGWPTTREWHIATAGHNTVVIDERKPGESLPDVSHRRPITPEMPADRHRPARRGHRGHPQLAVSDGGHGNALNDPKLRCFATDWDTVVSRGGRGRARAFPDPEVHRRTVALVRIDDRQVYALDIFRVRGGAMHDWMLHGCLRTPTRSQSRSTSRR